MQLRKILFERYLPPIVASIVFAVLGSIYSAINYGNLTEFFYSINPIIWMFLVIIFIIWVIIVVIRKKMYYFSLPIGYYPTGG